MFKYLQAVKFAKKFAKTAACVFVVAACDELSSSKTIEQPQVETLENSTLLKRAIYSSEFQLDPHKIENAAKAAPVRDLLVGLVAYNAKGEIVPAIAQSWFSEDEKTWLFVLDEQAKWSNGEAVTADDFVASWQRLIEPENHSSLAKYLVYMNVENASAIQNRQKSAVELGVKALNAHTLQIRLSNPNHLLPKMLAHSALLPTYKGIEPDSSHFIGNAAYQLEQLEPKKMVLKARLTDIPFQVVQYELIETTQNHASFDIVENPRWNQKKDIVKFPRLCSYYYEFNFDDPQLRKKDVREALRTMVSSANIGEGYGIPSQSVIPHQLVKDREKAWNPIVVETLLTRAGISLHNPLKLSLLYDESELNTEVANGIVRTLSQSELFRITPQAIDWQTLHKLRERQDFQLVRGGWCADYPDSVVFLQKFHSNSPDNHLGYKNEMVDQKLERLQKETVSQAERAKLIRAINDQLYEDVAVLPLFQYQYRKGIISSISGIDLNNDSEVIYSKDLQRISTQKD